MTGNTSRHGDLAVVRPSLDALRALRDGPHEFLLALRRAHGTAIDVRVGPFGFHLLSDPGHVQTVLVEGHRRLTRDTFQYRLLSGVTGDGLLTMDGPDWLSRRRREQPLFHREAVAAWAGVILESAERLLDDWAVSARSGAPRDVAADMLRVALDVVSGVLFPASFAYDRTQVLDATMEVLAQIMARSRTLGLVPPWLPTAGNRRFRRSLAVLDAVLYTMIRERRGMPHGGADLLSHLMFEADGSPTGLPDRTLRDELLTMIIAGHETVASALAWSWHLLAENPDQDERLAASPALPTGTDCARAAAGSFAALVFEETLRLFPPAWVITRKAVEPVDAGGFTIPAGGLVAISPWVIHRDPALWPEPARFDPSRHVDRVERNTFIPFGAGPHLCIGVHLARLEAAILLSLAAKRFRVRPVSGGAAVVEPGVTLHPRDGLWMRIERRAGE